MIQTRIEKAGLLDRIAGARAAVPGCLATANQALQGLLELTLDKDVVACRWKSEDTLAARLSEAAGKFHCWQGRNRMAIDALGLDVEGKLGEALVVSRDGSGNVIQKQAGGSARGLFAAGKPMTVNDAAMPEVGEALAVVRDGRLVRLASVVYKDPVTGLIATLETNEVPADALTCAPTFGWYALLRPRYDLKTFHGTYCTGQPACTTLVLAPATRGTYATEPECKCYTCGKSTRLAKALPRPAPAAKAPAAPAPASPGPAGAAAEQTKAEIVHNLEGEDFTGAYTKLDVQSMPQMLRILDLLDAERIEALLANLDAPHGRYTERLRAALTAAAAVDGRMAVALDRFAADVASLKGGDPREQQKGELLAYLRENDDDGRGAVGSLINRLQSKIARSPEVDGRMVVVEAGDPVSAHARVRYRVVATGARLGDEIIRWRWIDREREPGRMRWAGTPVGPEVENDRIRDDGSWEKSWPDDGEYTVLCLIEPKVAPSDRMVPPLTTLTFVQTVLPVDAPDSPLAAAFEANRRPPSYVAWRESLAPSAPPPPLKSRIECTGANPALVSSGAESTYTILPREDAKELTWYVRGDIPEDLGATYNDVYRREETDDGDEVIILPTSDDDRRARWVLSFPGRFDVVCEQRLADGRVLACVYTQVVEPKDTVDARAARAREVQGHLAAAHAAVMKLKDVSFPDPDYPAGYVQFAHAAVPVRANYLDYETGKVVTLPMFIGPAKAGGVLLLDLSFGADAMEYEGEDVAAAVEAFRTKNTYPTGRVRLAVTPNDWGVASHDRAFDTTGGPWTARAARWLSNASFAVGAVAMWIPGGQILGLAILVTSVTGAAAGALNVYDELQKREPDFVRVAVDVVGIAGAIVGAASGVHGLVLGDAYAISDRAGKFYHLSGLSSAVPGAVLLHVDFIGQLDKALATKDPQDRREAVQELLVDLLLQEAMLSVQVRDLHDNAKHHTHAEVEVHDHAMGVAGVDYFIEKVGKGNPRTLLKHIEKRFEVDAKLREQSAKPTYEVVKQTRAELDAMELRGASEAAQTAYVTEQLAKILGASDETPFNHAYEIRDELIKEWIDKRIGLVGQRYAHYIADVMRMLARDGVVYSEQSVSVKKLATTMPERDFVKARRKLREASGGKLDIDMRLLAMVTTSGISEPTLPAPEETASQPATAEARQEQLTRQMQARQAGFDQQFAMLGQVILRGDVIGVDIAGPEMDRFSSGQGMENFRKLYDLLKDVARTRNRAMVLRPHVGEGYAAPGAPEGAHVATAQHNVTTLLDALEAMGYSKARAQADGVVIRFGHATHATPEQIKRMGEMGIYAEANIGSNVATGSIASPGAHPLLYNLYFETPTILSTDGGGVMHTSLETEYTRAAEIIQKFKTDPDQKIKVDGKEKGWADLTADERSRFDIERLKTWAKGYRRSVLEDDLWARDNRGVVHELR